MFKLYGVGYDDLLLQGKEIIDTQKSSQIIEYIRKQQTPISIGQLRKAFPSYAKRSLKTYLGSQDEIINYRNRYISIQQLDITDTEKILLQSKTQLFVQKYTIVHIEDLYMYLKGLYSDLLTRLFINNSYELYSVISRLLKDDFAYRRPFVGLRGYEIPTTQEWLWSYADNYEEISLSDIVSYAKEKNLQLNNMIDFIVSINHLMFLKERNVLIQRRRTGIDASIGNTVESLIYDELNSTKETKAIRDLECIVKFPQINVPWNEWLVFSCLLDNRKTINLFTTSKKYKDAIPVVSLKSEIRIGVLQEITEKYKDAIDQDTNIIVDDLDDIDSLIEDEIELDDIDFDFDDDFDEFE